MPDGDWRLTVPGWRWCIYVDGSAKGSTAGWAVALVKWHEQLQACYFEGIFGNQLDCSPAGAFHVGEDAEDALQAEQVAICWGLLWSIQHGGQDRDCCYEICFDCRAAGDGAVGDAAPAGASNIAKTMRGVQQLIENMHGMHMSFRHVKAHDGEAWNELVDIGAKTAIGIYGKPRQRRLLKPPETVAKLVKDINWEWAWIVGHQADGALGCYIQHDHLMWRAVRTESYLRPQDLVPTQTADIGRNTTHGEFEFRVLSANVQTMKHKHRYLEDQMLEHRLGIACYQEVKTQAGFVESAHFLRYTSDAQQHWGTEVWIAKEQFQDGKKLSVQRADVTLLLSKPPYPCRRCCATPRQITYCVCTHPAAGQARGRKGRGAAGPAVLDAGA